MGVLSEAREQCSNCRGVLQRGWCLRRLALGLHPPPWPTTPCLCFHISKWGLMTPLYNTGLLRAFLR